MLVIEIGQPHHLETNPFGLRPSAERSDRRLGARSFLQIGPPLARPQTFIEEALANQVFQATGRRLRGVTFFGDPIYSSDFQIELQFHEAEAQPLPSTDNRP